MSTTFPRVLERAPYKVDQKSKALSNAPKTSLQNIRSKLYELTSPPEIDTTRGVNNIKRLQAYSDLIFEAYKCLVSDIQERNEEISSLKDLNHNLSSNLEQKMTIISTLRGQYEDYNRSKRSLEENERLLLAEKKTRQDTEKELERTRHALQNEKIDFQKYKETVNDNTLKIFECEARIKELEAKTKELSDSVKDKSFQIDGLHVDVIKFERLNEGLSSSNEDLKAKAAFLTETANALYIENGQLQKRIKELIEANKEVTANYQVVKKNFDLKKHEADELGLELDEAKNACQLALKQKKAIKDELVSLTKAKAEVDELFRREKNECANYKATVEELVKRITEIELEYEEKINMKEEQIWNVNAQRQEEASRAEAEKARALSAANRKREEAAALAAAVEAAKSNVENELISDIEKKWQRKEKSLLKEIEEANTSIREMRRTMQHMANHVSTLEKEQYQPRMVYLQSIEMIMRQKLIEFTLSEEKLETGFICPRDLKLLEDPVTLSPCSHTFCACCVDEMKQENFNILKCSVCKTTVESTFKNEKLASIKEQLIQRRNNTKIFADWLKTLDTYHPLDKKKGNASTQKL